MALEDNAPQTMREGEHEGQGAVCPGMLASTAEFRDGTIYEATESQGTSN